MKTERRIYSNWRFAFDGYFIIDLDLKLWAFGYRYTGETHYINFLCFKIEFSKTLPF